MKKSVLRIMVSAIVFLLPETSFFGFKRFLYRMVGCEIGEGTQICSSARIFPNGKIIIGKNVWIGQEVIISSSGEGRIVIEDYARVGMRCIVVNGFHEITPDGDCIEGEGTSSNILLKKGCAVSTMSLVLPGKTVGKMSHVAAGSIVTKDVPDYSRVAGIPAKVIKMFRE